MGARRMAVSPPHRWTCGPTNFLPSLVGASSDSGYKDLVCRLYRSRKSYVAALVGRGASVALRQAPMACAPSVQRWCRVGVFGRCGITSTLVVLSSPPLVEKFHFH